MAISAASLVDRASKVVQDTTNVRWPIAELVQWLNDGQREIIMHRPDANPKVAQVTLASGTRQTLTSGSGAGGVGGTDTPAKLLDVVCNVSGTARAGAVRLIRREVLDAQTRGWHAETASADIKHYMTDPRNPLDFYVYPPSSGGTAKLEVLFSAYPTDIALASGVPSGNISLTDVYGNPLLDYMLYRSYSKDAEYAGNAQRAQFHQGAFASSMGIELKGTVMMGPTLSGSIWNPNTPKLNGMPGADGK